MIDSHCHLADKQFKPDREEVIRRAQEKGVTHMISISDSLVEAEECIQISEAHSIIFTTVGVHPHNAKDWTNESEGQLKKLVVSSKKVIAIGEIGLDYHYDFSPRDTQRKVFEAQLKLAKELQLPVVVHCREAVEDVWKIVQEYQPKKLVLHCCTEKWNDVARFIERGYMLSFTGIATYPKSEEIRETIRQCPVDQLMIETDAPYLAPIPHRGKRNEPAYVVEVLRTVAKIKDLDEAKIDRVTTQNAVDFFGI